MVVGAAARWDNSGKAALDIQEAPKFFLRLEGGNSERFKSQI